MPELFLTGRTGVGHFITWMCIYRYKKLCMVLNDWGVKVGL